MDWILCRYTEVLLNFAETAVKTGHENEAIEVLQTIRRRAGIPQGNNNYGIGNATGDALLALIIKERLLELSYEADGFRVFDLLRLGLTLPAKGTVPAVEPNFANYIWPKPTSEASTNSLINNFSE
jgi:hypothetical protein